MGFARRESARLRPWTLAACVAISVSAACAAVALVAVQPWAEHTGAARPNGPAIAAEGATLAGLEPTADRQQNSKAAFFALQPRSVSLPPLRAAAGPPTFVPPSALPLPPEGPVMVQDPGGFGMIRLALSVAAGVLALLSVAQLLRLTFASWRGEIFSAQHGHGPGLRLLAWLTLLIGLADFCSTILRMGFGASGAPGVAIDLVTASAAVLASSFLFLFAHAVSEGAKMADEHLHTV